MHNNPCVAALPQLDRGSDYESERHRFESYTPHHLRLKLPATGAFLLRKQCMDSNLGRGAGVKKTPRQRRPGHAFPMAAQAKSASRNPRSDWDVVSGWRLKRKLRPGIHAQTGMSFPQDGPQAPPDANLSHLYIDLDRFAENSNSASTCVFANLNSRQ